MSTMSLPPVFIPKSIYEVDINGGIQYCVFATDHAHALQVLKDTIGVDWVDEPSDTVTINFISEDEAKTVIVESDDEPPKSLQDIYEEEYHKPGAVVSCSEW